MRSRSLIAVALTLAAVLLPPPARSQDAEVEPPAAADPLAPFEPLIGGRWHLEGSYQELEWGVGRRSVRARSYFVVEGEPKLVSEGFWYWHPGEEQIRGIFTAIDMPVTVFDYTTRFEDGKMVSDLRAWAATGEESVYVETWELTDDAHFLWKLFGETPEGTKEMMGGTYERK